MSVIALKSILVPIDFSETSQEALKYATVLCTAFRAKLHMLHIGGKAVEEMATEFPLGLDEAQEAAIRERLLKVLSPKDQIELRPEFVVRGGSPYLEIIRYAKERNIDLIIMGTHGRGFVSHMLLGSVAEKVVRVAPCPVLTVRCGEHDFVIPDAEAGAATSS